jgi:hypothetical protein
MGQIRAYPPVKLFVAVILAAEIGFSETQTIICRAFGELDLISALLPFSHTRFYEREMGSGLQRCIFSLAELQPAEKLVSLKQAGIRLEQEYSSAFGKRRINIDPGYVNHAKMVLASSKDYAHRIYLGAGIFADLQYVYSAGKWQMQPWTYPDYAFAEIIDFFTAMRKQYDLQLRDVVRRGVT